MPKLAKTTLKTIPVTLDFDRIKPIGYAKLQTNLLPKNLHEYVLAPMYEKDKKGKWQMLEYGLVHRKDLPTHKKMLEMEQSIGT